MTSEPAAVVPAVAAAPAAELAIPGAEAAIPVGAGSAITVAPETPMLPDAAAVTGTDAVPATATLPATAAVPAIPTLPATGTLPATAIIQNIRFVERDSIAVGIVNASTPFLPVLLLRLGGTTFEVGLLTALPAIAGFISAIPVGRFLQARRNVVPWYSRARLIAQLGFGAMAIAMLLLPQGAGWAPGAAPAALAVLAIWALQTVPNTVVNVAFPVIMDGAAGSSRRLDLLSRRWSLMGFTTAITVAVAGQALGYLPFPDNYALLFGVFAAAAIGSWWNSHQIRLPDQAALVRQAEGARLRLSGFLASVRAEPRFLRFEARSFLYTACVYMAAPLLPLYYVRELNASDAWIGTIGAAVAAAQLLGYILWRRVSRRRGTHAVVRVTILGYALAPALLTMLGALPAVAGLMAIAAVFAAGASLVLFEELMRRVPQASAVTFTAIDQSTQNLAATIGPIASGVLATAFGIRPALICASVVGVTAFTLFSVEGRGIGARIIRAIRRRR